MCKGSYFELVICGWAIYFREPGCPQQSSRLVKCSQSQTLKLTNLESLAVIQTSVKVTPSTHPRYIDIFTRPSNTPELWKINMIWLLGHTTTAVSSTVCYIYTYTPRSLKSQPSFPWKVNWSYTLCLHWCVLSWDRDDAFQPKRQWNPSKHHPFETAYYRPWTCSVCFPLSSLVLWKLGGSQIHWVAAWHSESSYHVDLLQSRKTSLPRVFTKHFSLVNRRSGLTPILK